MLQHPEVLVFSTIYSQKSALIEGRTSPSKFGQNLQILAKNSEQCIFAVLKPINVRIPMKEVRTETEPGGRAGSGCARGPRRAGPRRRPPCRRPAAGSPGGWRCPRRSRGLGCCSMWFHKLLEENLLAGSFCFEIWLINIY